MVSGGVDQQLIERFFEHFAGLFVCLFSIPLLILLLIS